VISLTLNVEPVAWGRVKRGAYGQAYVPAKTRKYEATIAKLIRAEYRGQPLEGALSLSLHFFMQAPKKRVRPYPSVRPDLDNLVKAVKDAANGLLWKDDGQISSLEAMKLYAPKDEKPCVVIAVSQLPYGLEMLARGSA
jgi:Holliday junction resolvase RusA-like endonuclease